MSNIKIADLNTRVSQIPLEDLTIQEIDNIMGGWGFVHINIEFLGHTIYDRKYYFS